MTLSEFPSLGSWLLRRYQNPVCLKSVVRIYGATVSKVLRTGQRELRKHQQLEPGPWPIVSQPEPGVSVLGNPPPSPRKLLLLLPLELLPAPPLSSPT